MLAALWAADGALTAAHVRQAVSGTLAYNTVQTILVRLYEKGLIGRVADGRRHEYFPVKGARTAPTRAAAFVTAAVLCAAATTWGLILLAAALLGNTSLVAEEASQRGVQWQDPVPELIGVIAAVLLIFGAVRVVRVLRARRATIRELHAVCSSCGTVSWQWWRWTLRMPSRCRAVPAES